MALRGQKSIILEKLWNCIWGQNVTIQLSSYFQKIQKLAFRGNSCFVLRAYEETKYLPSSRGQIWPMEIYPENVAIPIIVGRFP